MNHATNNPKRQQAQHQDRDGLGTKPQPHLMLRRHDPVCMEYVRQAHFSGNFKNAQQHAAHDGVIETRHRGVYQNSSADGGAHRFGGVITRMHGLLEFFAT